MTKSSSSDGTAFTLNEAFSIGVRDICYELLKMAYYEVALEDEYEEGWHEDRFTQQIVKQMRVKNREEVNDYIDISWEEKTMSDRSLSLDQPPNEVGEVDIKITRVRKRKHARFWIECKRLRGDDSRLIREYFKSGISRYVCSKYAEEKNDRGSMAGYVLQGEFDEIEKKLFKKLDDYEERLQVNQPLQLEDDDDTVRRYTTTHGSVNGGEFRLDHFLLDLRGDVDI